MTHEFLDNRDVAAAADEVHREGVPELMGMEAHAGCLADSFEKMLQTLLREGLVALVGDKEKWRGILFLTSFFEVVGKLASDEGVERLGFVLLGFGCRRVYF